MWILVFMAVLLEVVPRLCKRAGQSDIPITVNLNHCFLLAQPVHTHTHKTHGTTTKGTYTCVCNLKSISVCFIQAHPGNTMDICPFAAQTNRSKHAHTQRSISHQAKSIESNDVILAEMLLPLNKADSSLPFQLNFLCSSFSLLFIIHVYALQWYTHTDLVTHTVRTRARVRCSFTIPK